MSTLANVEIQPHPTDSGVFRLTCALQLPQPVEEVFDFFSAARNLEEITPPWLNFHVITPEPIEMHTGQLIDYRLRLHGIPIKWRTEIAEWEPPFRFVDRQLKGPYKLWYHLHTFEANEDGTLAKDQVDYAVPGGQVIGGLANSLLVQRDVQAIFEYRSQKLAEIFGADTSQFCMPCMAQS